MNYTSPQQIIYIYIYIYKNSVSISEEQTIKLMAQKSRDKSCYCDWYYR